VSTRLTPIEAIMWRAGQDPTLRMTVGDLMVLDRAPTSDELATRLTEAAAKTPRLRRRPDDPAGLRLLPAWIDDEFEGHDHLQTLAAPAPGGQRELLDLLALLETRPFSPDCSPWDVTLIEGLEGGRAALYLRAHHALTDGMGGITLIGSLLDEQEGPEAATSDQAEQVAQEGSGAAPEGDDVSSLVTASVEQTAERRPGTVTVTIDLTRAAGAAKEAAVAARNIDPVETAVQMVQRGLETVTSIARQAVVAGGPLSSLPPARSVTNRFEVLSVPGARSTALALGGSRNDLLVAATAAGVGAYQARLGLAATELRFALPAARHRDGDVGGNWFAPTRVEVPTDGGHPAPFFGVVTDRLARARHEPAVRLSSSVASAVSRLPTRALHRALHAQARSVDVVVTAFPGLRGPRTICGARVEESYPFGPRLGCLMNVTGFGIGDRLDVGVTLDSSAIVEPDLLVECLVSAFSAFGPRAGPSTGTRQRSAKS
jgi:WS/DGAT/MGAT family acyltransferase